MGLGPVEMGTTLGGDTESNLVGVGVNLDETVVRGLGTGNGSRIRLLVLDNVDSEGRDGTEGYPWSVSFVSEPLEFAASWEV